MQDMEGFFDSLDAMGAEEKTRAMTLIQKLVSLQEGGKKVDYATCVQMAFEQVILSKPAKILDACLCLEIDAERFSGGDLGPGTQVRSDREIFR